MECQMRAALEKAEVTAQMKEQALRAEMHRREERHRHEELRAETDRKLLEERMRAALEMKEAILRAEMRETQREAKAEMEKAAMLQLITDLRRDFATTNSQQISASARELLGQPKVEQGTARTEKIEAEQRNLIQAMRAEIRALRGRQEVSREQELFPSTVDPGHCQATGGDQANATYLELERMGFKVWASDLTKEGMLKGIGQAAAFILFLSVGVLQRPYCQMEIRHALALKKPVVLLHESDARYGSFDFRVAHAEADADLQELLDQHESLPFRRRGYERDGMLRTVIERCGFKDAYEASRTGADSKTETLATVPSTVAHFALDALFERPVQAELVALLLLRKESRCFTSCVVVHGMGGTGKTRYLLADSGRDAVGEKIGMLQGALFKQLTGKIMKADEKDDHERQAMLVEVMPKKQKRALLVLDDPWMPEQVRFLNPIDSSQMVEHRLLITTRIRDLVPKATRVELPLMDKDEAVALLLELANVEETSYRKENPEERVIGAGLKALEKNKDGAAVKALFHMFAVTMEDFVHPISVVELLWLSCCASESEKQEHSLTTRLKVRQWTQLLVDHSLLLGSSSEGIHLHDIVLTYLRKRRSTEESRELHRQVFDGLEKASKERVMATRSGFEDCGSTARPFDGEEIDWYSCNVGSYHVRRARDPAVGVAEDENIKRWVLLEDSVLMRAAALAVGTDELMELVKHFLGGNKLFQAAKTEFAIQSVIGLTKAWAVSKAGAAAQHGEHAALALLEQIRERGDYAHQHQQLELNLICSDAYGASSDLRARIEELVTSNPELNMDLLSLAVIRFYPRARALMGETVSAWDDGYEPTEDNLFESMKILFDEMLPMFAKSATQCVGARREAKEISHFAESLKPFIASTERVANIACAYRDRHWGDEASTFLKTIQGYSISRHSRECVFWS
eukprot:g1514.t1